MDISSIVDIAKSVGVPAYPGYAPSMSRAPYIVVRPMSILGGDTAALCGQELYWDNQLGAYCVGNSVEASDNLAKALMRALNGRRVAGTVVSVSMGYSGALIEGLYESQVTIQTNQGALL